MSYDSNVRAVVTEEGYEKLKAYSIDNNLKEKLGYSIFEVEPETFKQGNGFVYFGWGTFARMDRKVLEDALKYLDFNCNMPYRYAAIGEDLDDCIELNSVTEAFDLPWPELIRQFDDNEIELYLETSTDEKKHRIKFDFGKINQIALSYKCKMEELVDNINLGQAAKITDNMIFEWLEAHGLGETAIVEGWAVPDFVPSERGVRIGIELEDDKHLRFDMNAQAFIIANLDKIIDFAVERHLFEDRFFLRDENTVEWIRFETEEGRDRFAVNVIGKEDVLELENVSCDVNDFFTRLNDNTKQFLFFEDENHEAYNEIQERFFLEPICVGLGKTSFSMLTDVFAADEKELDDGNNLIPIREQITDKEKKIADKVRTVPDKPGKEMSDIEFDK